MKQQQINLAIAVALVASTATTWASPRERHQLPEQVAPVDTAAPGCQAASQQALQTIGTLEARLESARQTNNPAQLRTAMDDLQAGLVALRAQIEECAAPPPGQDYGMSTMPGMDHSKMARVEIAFTSQPAPLMTGDNRFDVTVASADGQAIANADVSVILVMPAMPAMNMPETRNEVRLTSAGGGRYSGTGQVTMAGQWQVTVSVKRDGQVIGQKTMTVRAQ